MVYSNKFVMCILLNGKPQEELANGQVKLPFDVEYALRLRNRNNRRAVVKLYIDGENVSAGGYVIPANDHVDIKRHHDVDRAFKFVSLDSEDAIDFGKNGPNEDKVKGTIEARFYLEKERPQVVYRDVHHDHHHHHHHDHYPTPRPQPWPIRPYVTCDTPLDSLRTCGGPEMICSTGGGSQSSAGPMRPRSLSRSKTAAPAETLSFNAPAPDLKLNDGCTVEGYSTGQNFTSTWVDTEETYTSLKVFLQGFEDEKPVEVAKKPRKMRKGRKTNKDIRLDDLKSENEELRRKLAEIENEKLKKKLKDAEK